MARRIGQYFTDDEFECGCGCGAKLVHLRLVEILDAVRGKLGVGVQVNSGVRCRAWNKHVGSKYPNSYHVPRSMQVDGSAIELGLAADITLSRHSHRQPINILRLYALLESLSRPTAIGLGLYPSWCHIDVRGLCGGPGGSPAPARWEVQFPFPRL